MNVWQTIKEEFECEHSDAEIRYKIDSIGRRQYVKQCLDCGCVVGSFISHSKITDSESIHPFCLELQDAYYKARQKRVVELQTTQNKNWWNEYNAYLRSPKWVAKRNAVLERDGYICQACLWRSATEVHHLTYKHVFDEPLFELVAICSVCHQKITEADNERRNATSSG